MKTITKYVADDGTEFTDKGKCANHEALCKEIAGVMSALPPLPENYGCGFANGGGYIQHDPAVFWIVRDTLLLIARRFTDHHWLDQSLVEQGVHPSYAARIIDECCPGVLGLAFHRILCTCPKSLREYGQPYYVANPDKAEGGQINL